MCVKKEARSGLLYRAQSGRVWARVSQFGRLAGQLVDLVSFGRHNLGQIWQTGQQGLVLTSPSLPLFLLGCPPRLASFGSPKVGGIFSLTPPLNDPMEGQHPCVGGELQLLMEHSFGADISYNFIWCRI